jgi:hypothetical protein
LELFAKPGLNIIDAAPHIRRWRIRTDGRDLPVALARPGAQQPHDLNLDVAALGLKRQAGYSDLVDTGFNFLVYGIGRPNERQRQLRWWDVYEWSLNMESIWLEKLPKVQ